MREEALMFNHVRGRRWNSGKVDTEKKRFILSQQVAY